MDLFGSGHQIHHQPGEWGRGILTRDGEVHTWPESEALMHRDYGQFDVQDMVTDHDFMSQFARHERRSLQRYAASIRHLRLNEHPGMRCAFHIRPNGHVRIIEHPGGVATPEMRRALAKDASMIERVIRSRQQSLAESWIVDEIAGEILAEFEPVGSTGVRPLRPRVYEDRPPPDYARFERHYARWQRRLPASVRATLRRYTSRAGMDEVNEMLRRHGGSHPRGRKHFDYALKSARLPESVTLYRGVGADYDNDDRLPFDPKVLRPGAVVRDPGYVSTSLDRDTAREYADPVAPGYIFHIHARRGQRAAYLGGDLGFDEVRRYGLPAEHEVLLPRNTRFRVHSVTHPRQIPGFMSGTTRWAPGHVHMTIVD